MLPEAEVCLEVDTGETMGSTQENQAVKEGEVLGLVPGCPVLAGKVMPVVHYSGFPWGCEILECP